MISSPGCKRFFVRRPRNKRAVIDIETMAEVPEICVAAVQDQHYIESPKKLRHLSINCHQLSLMHACLRIPEIVDLICAFVDPTYRDPDFWDALPRTSRQPWLSSLAAMARTCSMFHRCAVKYLWRSVTLGNLLCCLPSDVVVVDRVGRTEYRMCPLRPVCIDDWRRVLVYASCVKRLFSGSDDLDIADMLPVVCMCFPRNLLPKLESVHWWQHPSRWWQSDPTWLYIQLFLVPSLVTISFELPCTGAPSFLSTLAVKCPNLKNVSVKHGPDGVYLDSTTETRDVSLFTRSLHSLESVSARRLDTAALQHLSQLPRLKSLSLDHLPEASSTFFPPHSRKNFSALRTLHFGQTHLRPVIKILEWCNEAPLESFSIHLSEVHTASAMHSFCVALSAACSHSSLTSLFVENDADDLWGDENDHVVENRSIAILLCFTNLTSVAMTSPPGFELDNATVSDMAQAWPMLESLALVTKFFERPPSATLDCLSYFAAYCAHLESLTMTFDGTVPPDTAAGTTNIVAGHRLHHLDVGHSPIFSAIPAAGFIASLFPNLQDIRTGREHLENDLEALGEWEMAEHGEGIGYYNCWKEVEEEVQYLLQKSQPWRLPPRPSFGWRESLLLQISEGFDS